jgi:aminopeptidase YwaD
MAIVLSTMACSDQGSEGPDSEVASSPLSPGDSIRTLYSAEKIGRLMEDLVDLGPRVAGRPVEHQASKILKERFERFGLETSVEHYQVPVHWRNNCNSRLTFEGNVFPPMAMTAMTFTPPGKTTARVVYVERGFPENYAQYAAGMKGYLALIDRGTIPFAFKAQFAFEAGAVGAIVINYDDTTPSFNAATPPIPIATISRSNGDAIVTRLASTPELKATLNVDTERRLGPSWQVIGTLKGTRPAAGTLYVTAHYDSNALSGPVQIDGKDVCPYVYDYDNAQASPGANDNASGTAAIVEAARVMTKLPRPNATTRFIAFGGEEVGLSGSLAYVLAHRQEVMEPALGEINLDMVGVGENLLFGNGTLSQAGLVALTDRTATNMGILAYGIPGGMPQASDHAAFEWSGVPSLVMTRWYSEDVQDPNYHLPTDNLDNGMLSTALVEETGELATAVAYEFASNPPLRSLSPTTTKGEVKCQGRCNHK